MNAIKCGFCRLGTEVESICGKLHFDNKRTAAHQKCMEYSSLLVQYDFDYFGGFKIEEVKKEIRRGKRLPCSVCYKEESRRGKWTGATAGCELKSCRKTFHYYCAELDDVVLTNRIEYRVFCSEEHFKEFKLKNVSQKNQHQQLLNINSDRKSEIMEENHQNEAPTNILNSQSEDITYLSDSSDVSNGECSTENGDDDDCYDDDDCLVSCDEIDCQSLNDSSESEMENPISRQEGYKRFKADRQAMNRSKNQNCGPHSDESRNETVNQGEKPNINKKQNTSKDIVSMNGSRISRVSKKAISNGKDNGDNKTNYITAEVHVATPPFSVDKKSTEEDASSNGEGYSSEHEITIKSNGFCSDTPDRNNIAEISSGSESQKRIQFPVCAVAISSTKKDLPSKEKMIIEKAKERFDVDNVAIWNTADCFSDELTDGYLPHLMNLITDMVSEKNFTQLRSLLTDKSCQNSHMDYYKHMANLPNGMIENIRNSLMKQLDRKEINGKELIFIDTKLNTLFLKLNNAVDETCTIRNILLPHVKEISGHLFEWKENTVSSAFLSQSEAEMEWKLINNWMTREKWNQAESSIIPSDNIFLEAKKNQGIEELIKHQSLREENTRKVIFVRAMNETVNCSMFIHRLILSCAESEETLIVYHSAPTTTLQSLIPKNLQKETDVQVMSAFKPSNKRGISIVVIHVCNQKQQKKNTSQSQICAPPCGDEGSGRLEEVIPLLNFKRRANVDRTSPKKRKRAA